MDRNNRRSSAYCSGPSSRKSLLRLETRANGANGSGSRPISYTPSYMSNLATRAPPNGQRSSSIPTAEAAPRAALEPSPGAPPESAGTLLLLSPGRLHPLLLFHLEMLLERHVFSSIVIAGSRTQEAELKQLRMDVFALLGKMRREVAVSMDMRDDWTKTEIEHAIQLATKGGQGLQGVLCCPELVEEYQHSDDVLGLEETQLEEAWKRSVGFLHVMSRAALPYLLSHSRPAHASNGHHAKAPQGTCFLVTQPSATSVASKVANASFDALLTQLGNATRSKGLTVGYAEVILVPSARPATPPSQDRISLQPSHHAADDNGFTSSESPTRLWNMWALQNDTPTFDN